MLRAAGESRACIAHAYFRRYQTVVQVAPLVLCRLVSNNRARTGLINSLRLVRPRMRPAAEAGAHAASRSLSKPLNYL